MFFAKRQKQIFFRPLRAIIDNLLKLEHNRKLPALLHMHDSTLSTSMVIEHKYLIGNRLNLRRILGLEQEGLHPGINKDTFGLEGQGEHVGGLADLVVGGGPGQFELAGGLHDRDGHLVHLQEGEGLVPEGGDQPGGQVEQLLGLHVLDLVEGQVVADIEQLSEGVTRVYQDPLVNDIGYLPLVHRFPQQVRGGVVQAAGQHVYELVLLWGLQVVLFIHEVPGLADLQPLCRCVVLLHGPVAQTQRTLHLYHYYIFTIHIVYICKDDYF